MDAGPVYTYSTGNKQHLYVNDPELVKEMNQSITSGLGKPTYLTRRLAPLLGNGILRSNGHVWAHQRKIVAPEFFVDKVKVTEIVHAAHFTCCNLCIRLDVLCNSYCTEM